MHHMSYSHTRFGVRYSENVYPSPSVTRPANGTVFNNVYAQFLFLWSRCVEPVHNSSHQKSFKKNEYLGSSLRQELRIQ